MQLTSKFGGTVIIIGAALNLTRLIPIFLNEQISLQNFPPATVAQVTETSLLPGWILSHIMGFLSVPLLIIGFIILYKNLSDNNQREVGLAAIVFASVGMFFYGVAVWIDGLLLPQTAETLLAASAADQTTAAMLQTYTHTMATTFGGLSLLATLLGVALMGFGVAHGFERRLIGGIGFLYGTVGIIGLSAGLIDIRMHENFMISAGYLFGAQAWFLALGVRMLRGVTKGIANVGEATKPVGIPQA